MIKLNYDELTAANILGISYTDAGKDEIKLEFDQTVTWKEEIIGRFYFDDGATEVTAVGGAGRIITMKLTGASKATNLS